MLVGAQTRDLVRSGVSFAEEMCLLQKLSWEGRGEEHYSARPRISHGLPKRAVKQSGVMEVEGEV